jgi:nucleoside-diphosphate-sugar epimerase
MIERALVIGGTQYFGKRLVQLLLEEGTRVTVASRGRAPDILGAGVDRIVVDRESPGALVAAVGGRTWDVVFDQVSFAPDDARDACAAFAGRIGRFVHTSTQSVHFKDGPLREDDFDPRTLSLKGGRRAVFNYADGKRLAEGVLFQEAPFPVAAARFPAVLGRDDSSGRLEFHIDHVREGRPIVPKQPLARMCFIEADEAARFLLWLGKGPFTEPLHACSNGILDFSTFLHGIQRITGGEVKIAADGPDEDVSPLVGPLSRYLVNDRARELGFPFANVEDWLPRLVGEVAARRRDGP